MVQPQIKVLLVEDNPDDVRLVKMMLHKAISSHKSTTTIHLDHEVRIKTTQKFLALNPCDLILLDLSLPDSLGLDTFITIKNNYPKIPVIILSGHANHELAIEAVQHGAQDYLDKNKLTPSLLLKSIHYGLERQRLLLEVSNRAAELESRNVALNDFAHTVAHQIQGLLSQMVGYASLVDAHYQEQLNDSAKMAVDQIMQSGYKMNNVITELLFLASMRSDNIEVGKLNNRRILVEVVKRLRYQIRETKAKISLPDDWPDALGYTPWVEEVWLNYMSNGLKYGGDESNPPHLQLGAQKEGNGMVRFWVKDDGPGISVIDQKRLFKPHTRVTSKKVRGEGVGLSIVRGIVKKCGGNVGVDSEEGAGSCFWFTLPEAV